MKLFIAILATLLAIVGTYVLLVAFVAGVGGMTTVTAPALVLIAAVIIWGGLLLFAEAGLIYWAFTAWRAVLGAS